MGKIREQSFVYNLLGYVALAAIIVLIFGIVAASVYLGPVLFQLPPHTPDA